MLPSAWRVPLIPVLTKPASKSLRNKTLRKVKTTPLSIAKKRAVVALLFWSASLIWVWSWWFANGRAELMWLYIPLSAALFYEFAFLPSAFLFFVLISKNPPRRQTLLNKKVALVTPCVPSQESMEVIERQLKAMSEVEYPHDSWILDESGNKNLKKIAKKYGVKYFTRKKVVKYNQADYPFKAKTKAGNVNAWLEHVKRRRYEYFVQLDIDHAPKPNYLHKTLGYFRDERVAWVQPPSVYSNTDNWIARGATEMDFAFQGPLQMGFYGFSEIPMIVGSHCVYRMSAVREIGGFQPTRAEDHLDTLVLAGKGWKGVFLPEVIAEGDGPETFGVFLAQQFAWSYSMFQILLRFSPKHLPKIPLRKIFPFIFSETFYPLWSLSYLLMFLAPIIALSLNRDIVRMRPTDFLVHLVPASLATLLIYFAGRPLMQPRKVRLSWRGIILQTVRWPIVMIAMLNALFNVQKPYMITPKGKNLNSAPPVSLYSPFLILGLISTAASILASLRYGGHLTSGQMIFTLFNAIFMATVCVLDLNIRMRSAVSRLQNLSFEWLKPATAIMTLILFISSAVVMSPMVQESTVNAFTGKTKTIKMSPNLLPVTMLSNQQLLQQITSQSDPQIDNSNVSVGIHDPKHVYDSGAPYIRHSFIDWRNPRDLAVEILRSERLGAVPLITVEPDGEKDGHALLQGIADGQYDQNLLALANVLSHANEPVYIRFAHEMDLSNLYPWGAQDPQLYVAAYRHAIDVIRSHNTPYVRWVWSPAGNKGTTEAYYPGDNYVDIVGTTILYDRYWSGDFHPTFAQLSSIRQWLEGYGKPVWITELGVGNSDPAYQARLLGDAVAHYKDYGFSALVYLNIDDANLKIPNYTFSSPLTVSKILGIDKPLAIAALSNTSQTLKKALSVVINSQGSKNGPAKNQPHAKKLTLNLNLEARPKTSNTKSAFISRPVVNRKTHPGISFPQRIVIAFRNISQYPLQRSENGRQAKNHNQLDYDIKSLTSSF